MVVHNSTDMFTYTPTTGYSGPDSFKYKANDGTDDSNEATQNITVTFVNAPPVCTAGSTTTNEDTPANDGFQCTDADGDSLTYSVTQSPAHGSVVVHNSTDMFTYTPTTGYSGPDSFKYKANDGTDDSNEATQAITVTFVNSPPVCSVGSSTTTENSPVTDPFDCTDADGDNLGFTITQAPAHGSVVVHNSTDMFTYTPTTGYSGPDSFKYKANDGTDDSNIVTQAITVTFVNSPPVAVGDSWSTNEDSALVVSAPGVLANDSDPDGDTLHSSLGTGPAHGSLSLSSNGGFTYTPAANYNGPDSFS